MTRLLLFVLLSAPIFIFAQTNMTLRSTTWFTNEKLSNIWGYTAGGNEYALVGGKNNTYIYNITDPDNPALVTSVPGPSSDWKEIKTFENYAYVVSEGGWGVQVIDLTNLPGSNLSYHSVYPEMAPGQPITKAHALHVDEVKGYLYLYGTNLMSGRPMICNLNLDPYNPVYAGFYNASGSNNTPYVHDGYCNNDTLFACKIYAGQFTITNCTNKTNPVDLGAPTNTPNNFTHNCWRSGNTIFTTDEVNSSYLASYDISDPTDVNLLDKIKMGAGSTSIVHNTYIKNNYAVTSWYKDGVVVVDAARPANMVITGHYDTYAGSGSGFAGCWGVFPYFPSGTIIASNITGTGAHAADGGMYILTPNYTRGCYLEGIVTNASTGNLLPGATVNILNSGVETENTASNGTYKMGRNGGGFFTVEVTKTGFETFSTTVSLSSGVLTTLNVPLVPKVLPIEMTLLEIDLQENNTALLHWQTATERDNLGYQIEQSNDGRNWENIGFEPACMEQKDCDYTFTSRELTPGKWLFRLGIESVDGNIQYSDLRSVAVAQESWSAKFAPNPVHETALLDLTFHQNFKEDMEILVLGSDGRTPVFTQKISPDARQLQVAIPLHTQPAGYYFVTMKTRTTAQTLSFFKQ